MTAAFGGLPPLTAAGAALWLHLAAACGLAGALLAAWLGAGGKRGDRPRRIAWWSFSAALGSGGYLLWGPHGVHSLAALRHLAATAFGAALAWKLVFTLALALGMALLWRRAAAFNLLLVAAVLGFAALLR